MKPWRIADGRIGGALLFNELITEQVEARRALAEAPALWDEIAEQQAGAA